MNQHRVTLHAGDRIFEQGDKGDCAYIIEEGEVAISTCNSEGQDVHLALLTAGNLVGEMALIDGGPRTASAIVLSTTKLVIIPEQHFTRLLTSADPTVTLFINVVLRRYRGMKERFDRLIRDGAIDSFSETPNQADKDLISQASLAIERVIKEQELKQAIDNNFLEMFYQPIYDLSLNRIVGCEALIRWIDPERGIIPPNLFISLAEETGLIEDIGYMIFRDANLAVAEFQAADASGSDFFVSINLSSRQIETDEQVAKLFDWFERKNIDLRHIKIEITETLLMFDQDRVREILSRFKTLGAQISLDDFGTGYSSFSYLHNFPIDTIKIDQSFVFSMSENEKSAAIVSSLCTLATSLNMQTIAEGVETLEVEQQLKSFGCGFAQGYYYAKPVPKTQFIELISA